MFQLLSINLEEASSSIVTCGNPLALELVAWTTSIHVEGFNMCNFTVKNPGMHIATLIGLIEYQMSGTNLSFLSRIYFESEEKGVSLYGSEYLQRENELLQDDFEVYQN
ncbi:hypothetical protein Tco_1274102 [Tanacetum coccineum]